jgi:hypothetical protein
MVTKLIAAAVVAVGLGGVGVYYGSSDCGSASPCGSATTCPINAMVSSCCSESPESCPSVPATADEATVSDEAPACSKCKQSGN